jgi:hypothetical protein
VRLQDAADLLTARAVCATLAAMTAGRVAAGPPPSGSAPPLRRARSWSRRRANGPGRGSTRASLSVSVMSDRRCGCIKRSGCACSRRVATVALSAPRRAGCDRSLTRRSRVRGGVKPPSSLGLAGDIWGRCGAGLGRITAALNDLERRSNVVESLRSEPGANKRPRATWWRHTPVPRSIAEIGPRRSNWTPSAHYPVNQNNATSRDFQPGRQDLNLRPPGPQPEGSGCVGTIQLSRAGSSCPELLSVALNLDPGLDPVGAGARCDCGRAVRAPVTIPMYLRPLRSRFIPSG